MTKPNTFSGVEELTNALAERRELTKKEAHSIVRDVLEIMEEELLREDRLGIQIINFMSMTKVVRKAKLGRNPKDPTQEYHIPERNSLKIALGKEFRDKLNNTKVYK